MPKSPTLPFIALCACLVADQQAWSASTPSTESIEQALCRLIETSAASYQVPVATFTKLIWRESSFRTHAVSSAGAQGIAQFMPGTARERGLADPFDPEQAIPKAAEFISHLTERFGNLGLAAAAYNAGPARVSSWLAGQGALPVETRNYVVSVTGQDVEDWVSQQDRSSGEAPPPSEAGEALRREEASELQSCMQIVTALRQPEMGPPAETPFAPWGVQLAGNFSKQRALAAFARASRTYSSVLEDAPPMVIGTRLRSRGTRTFYRVRVPAASRTEASRLCGLIRNAGGSCIVLPSQS